MHQRNRTIFDHEGYFSRAAIAHTSINDIANFIATPATQTQMEVTPNADTHAGPDRRYRMLVPVT